MIPSTTSIQKAGANKGDHEFKMHALESVLPELRDGNFAAIPNEMYSIVQIENGVGTIIIDLQTFTIDHETIYFIKPGQVFTVRGDQTLTGVVVCFGKRFLDVYDIKTSAFINSALFNQSCIVPVVKLNRDEGRTVKNIAGAMMEEFVRSIDLSLDLIKGFLKIFIIYISRHLNKAGNDTLHPRKSELTSTFYTLLEKNFTTKKMVKEYADILAVTPSYLNDSVKETSRFTASYHIQQRIVLEAKRRAVMEGYNLKQIAYYLGFWDPAHFSKYFKNSSGVSFTDFKKQSCQMRPGNVNSI